MSDLMKWPKGETPDDFYSKVSHLWLQHEDGRIEVVAKRHIDDNHADDVKRYYIHAEYWGDLAWETENRGYYSESYGLVTAHCGLRSNNTDLIHRLARKFRDAIYYRE